MTAQEEDTRVRIGVTGHRILAEPDRLIRGIEEALRRIQAGYPGRRLAVLSSLAEGADRLVAEAVLRTPKSRLVVVLPFPEEEYVADFGAEGSPSWVHYDSLMRRAAEVVRLPRRATRDEGYEQGGHYVVERCDVLLAVWDGQEAQGQGGTGEIVARAREQGKPVVIVRAGNRVPGTEEPTSLGEEQGRIVAERLRG
jgi:hypothetical protein